jgi:predicted metal-dependent enzyme (double-stranded beta helix superfamily)
MTLSEPLRDFTRVLDDLTARELAIPRLISLIAPEFARVLAEPNLLPPDAQALGATSYAQHLLHTSPDGRYTLVSLVWRPGDLTPVHDHVAWGLAGVYRGHEHETRYAWCDRTGTVPGLRPVQHEEICAGQVMPIVPPSDIHRVCNPDSTLTVSLHLYGFDLRRSPTGSSVRRVYGPELLVDEAAPGLRRAG